MEITYSARYDKKQSAFFEVTFVGWLWRWKVICKCSCVLLFRNDPWPSNPSRWVKQNRYPTTHFQNLYFLTKLTKLLVPEILVHAQAHSYSHFRSSLHLSDLLHPQGRSSSSAPLALVIFVDESSSDWRSLKKDRFDYDVYIWRTLRPWPKLPRDEQGIHCPWGKQDIENSRRLRSTCILFCRGFLLFYFLDDEVSRYMFIGVHFRVISRLVWFSIIVWKSTIIGPSMKWSLGLNLILPKKWPAANKRFHSTSKRTFL